MSSNDTYVFMSQPKAVTRPKYRDPNEDDQEDVGHANIMYDPRVARGKTFGRPMEATMAATQVMQRTVESRKWTPAMNRAHKKKLIKAGLIRPKPKSVASIHDNIRVVKKRVEVPLEQYLIEQEEPVKTVTQDTQTDTFHERPQTPEYFQQPTGVDMGTQVETSQVFQFDLDVNPILDVLTGKTLEQSLNEVREEEEFSFIRRKHAEITQAEAREAEEIKQRVQDERDLLEEKETILLKARQRAAQAAVLEEKISSTLFSKKFLRTLDGGVYDHLSEANFFYDPLRVDVEAFLPWLVDQAKAKLDDIAAARQTVDDMLKRSVDKLEQDKLNAEKERAAVERKAREAEMLRRQQEREKAKRRMIIQLYIHSSLMDEPVGPIRLSGESTVRDVEVKVFKWLEEHMDEPPEQDKLKFLWNGNKMDDSAILYELGVENLSTIQMSLDGGEEGGEGDEGDEEEEEEV